MNKQKAWAIYYLCISLFLVLAIGYGAIAGVAEVDFQKNKCNNLKSSSYNFNIELQTNAEYSERCFRVLKYALYDFEIIFLNILLSVFLIVMLTFLPFLLMGIKLSDICYSDTW